MQVRAVQYQFAHDRPLDVGATAQLLSNTLYYKRFFPYYAANLCVGLDPQGEQVARRVTTLCDELSMLQMFLPLLIFGSTCVREASTRLRYSSNCTTFLHRQGCRVHIRRHWLVRADRLQL